MNNLLTAKEVQELLHVDRSTVYRMAEDGRLPAMKVGKQWRFPANQLQEWIGSDVDIAAPKQEEELPDTRQVINQPTGTDLASMLPLECVQLIQDSHAELLGVMLVITDLEGRPVTKPSFPCGLFAAISGQPHAVQRCISSWHDLGQMLNIEPQFHTSHLGLLCARGLIRVGKELPGMVVAGCIAPDAWPPALDELEKLATELGVESHLITDQVDQVYVLDEEQRTRVLTSVQQVANIIAHIVQERLILLGKLNSIADLARL